MVVLEVIGIVVVSALAAGLIQGLTGFGSAIVMMAFLPLYFGVLESSALVGVVTLSHSLAMVWLYRQHIQVKQTIGPAVLFIATTALSILYAQHLNPQIVTIIFGIFLMTLSFYFLRVNPDGLNPNRLTSLLFIALSGITNGLFGIGGPLMVIYYVSKIKEQKAYLGTMQFFFTLTSLSSAAIRFSTGILTLKHLPITLIGVLAILAGLLLANGVMARINAQKVRQLTYLFIGLSGFYNLLTALF